LNVILRGVFADAENFVRIVAQWACSSSSATMVGGITQRLQGKLNRENTSSPYAFGAFLCEAARTSENVS
jgi:hypothetical protein